MRAKAKFWLETEGGSYLLGPGALGLLVAVERTGSLKAGAKVVGLSYRGAWDRLKKAEEGLGFPLLVRHSGGEGGGGSSLSPRAQDLVRRYERFLQVVEEDVEKRFLEAFADWEEG
ncbi:MAG: ModE family transcriptional regulator [Meiothermus sp.]